MKNCVININSFVNGKYFGRRDLCVAFSLSHFFLINLPSSSIQTVNAWYRVCQLPTIVGYGDFEAWNELFEFFEKFCWNETDDYYSALF